jgi:hypothetical protein
MSVILPNRITNGPFGSTLNSLVKWGGIFGRTLLSIPNIIVDNNGQILFTGTARYKDTRWIGANGIKAVPSQPATFVEYGIGGAWQFADAVSRSVSGRLGVVHNIDSSATPYLLFGWSCPTADPGDNSKQVRWEIKYSWRGKNDPMDAAPDATVVDNYTTSQTAKGLIQTDIALSALSATDICLGVHITRIGGDSGDTAGDAAHLFGMCLWYTFNKPGEAV